MVHSIKENKRLENTALMLLIIQFFAALLCYPLAISTNSSAFFAVTIQAGIGIIIMAFTWFHLRIRRIAQEEAEDIELADSRRQTQGLDSLFDGSATLNAATHLSQYEKYVAPAASLIIACLLALPFSSALFSTTVTSEWFMHLLPSAVACAIMAFVLFVPSMYAAGLSRHSGGSALRAAAGYGLSTSCLLFLVCIGLTLLKMGWIAIHPDWLIKWLIYGWMALQAIEIFTNVLLDLYRPRVAGVDARMGYDSRLSGLLAEPHGLVRTFAHTLDYQFGFRISETWFFQFLEKSFIPLLLIQLFAFYLMSCVYVIQPGQYGIVERFGSPRMITVDGEKHFAPASSNGIGFKLPWPFETVRIVDADSIQVLTFGSCDHNTNNNLFIGFKWDQQHECDDVYLLSMRISSESSLTALMSGSFSLRYYVTKDGAFNNHYRFRSADKMLHTYTEREMTMRLAGYDLEDILINKPGEFDREMTAAIQNYVKEEGLGFEIVSFRTLRLHPSTTELGMAFQKAVANKFKAKELIESAHKDSIEMIAKAESDAGRILYDARNYENQRRVISAAYANWFNSQQIAYKAAPFVYLSRARLKALTEALSKPYKILAPKTVQIDLDHTKVLQTTDVHGVLSEVLR